ncbi:MAG: prepilin-type N-terminal cleavage/methylation domain-containing protein [Aquabacterium sp.]
MCAERPERRASRRSAGFTLPEMLLAIVVLGIGLAGLLSALGTLARSSADPVIQRQMLSIAEGLMEEIQLKPFTSAANTAPSGCARDTYNDVADYDGYATDGAICAVDGTKVELLSGYSVKVAVQAEDLAGVSRALRITVTVVRGSDSLTLDGWRVDHAS